MIAAELVSSDSGLWDDLLALAVAFVAVSFVLGVRGVIRGAREQGVLA